MSIWKKKQSNENGLTHNNAWRRRYYVLPVYPHNIIGDTMSVGKLKYSVFPKIIAAASRRAAGKRAFSRPTSDHRGRRLRCPGRAHDTQRWRGGWSVARTRIRVPL